jgi:hypothetical protein
VEGLQETVKLAEESNNAPLLKGENLLSSYFPSIIDTASTGTYTVSRKAAPTYVKGRLQPTAVSTTFTITASVQPLTGQDMSLLPEGSRADNTKILFTTTRINTVGSAEPDVVSIESEDYEVFSVETWIGFGDTYYRTLVRKRD